MAALPLQPDLAITSALAHRPMCVMRMAEAKACSVTGRVGTLANRCVAAHASTQPGYSGGLNDERSGLSAERPIPESTAPPQRLSRQVIFSDGLGGDRRALFKSEVTIRMRPAALAARDDFQHPAA